MGRLNVLSLAGDDILSAEIRKILNWNFRDHAFFQPESVGEAKRLLLLFRIHLVISDESFSPKELTALKQSFPEVHFFSITRDTISHEQSGINKFPETELKVRLKSFIKDFKKENSSSSREESLIATFGNYDS